MDTQSQSTNIPLKNEAIEGRLASQSKLDDLFMEVQTIKLDLENHKRHYTRKKCDQITTAHDLIR